MQVHLTRDEIVVAVSNYIRVMFATAVIVSDITIGGSGQRITAEVEIPDLTLEEIPPEEEAKGE